VERAFQSPVLGVNPAKRWLLGGRGLESPHAEAYRVLRTNILFSRKDEKLNTVVRRQCRCGRKANPSPW